MNDATIAIPEELDAELEAVAREQGLTTAEVIAAALRVYRAEIHRYRPPADRGDFRPFWVPVLPEKDDKGEPDVSINHDKYLAESTLARKLPKKE